MKYVHEQGSTAAARSRSQREDARFVKTREAVLADSAAAAGVEWALEWRSTLAHEGRTAAGGWPGTVPEARSRVSEALRRAGMLAPTSAELEAATRTTYATARQHWLASVARDDSDD